MATQGKLWPVAKKALIQILSSRSQAQINFAKICLKKSGAHSLLYPLPFFSTFRTFKSTKSTFKSTKCTNDSTRSLRPNHATPCIPTHLIVIYTIFALFLAGSGVFWPPLRGSNSALVCCTFKRTKSTFCSPFCTFFSPILTTKCTHHETRPLLSSNEPYWRRDLYDVLDMWALLTIANFSIYSYAWTSVHRVSPHRFLFFGVFVIVGDLLIFAATCHFISRAQLRQPSSALGCGHSVLMAPMACITNLVPTLGDGHHHPRYDRLSLSDRSLLVISYPFSRCLSTAMLVICSIIICWHAIHANRKITKTLSLCLCRCLTSHLLPGVYIMSYLLSLSSEFFCSTQLSCQTAMPFLGHIKPTELLLLSILHHNKLAENICFEDSLISCLNSAWRHRNWIAMPTGNALMASYNQISRHGSNR